VVAEECLLRGQPDKAEELASRALAARPDSLEAKAVLDRARRQHARQRRRSRQEQRLQQAQALLETGDAAGAEKLVESVLKRMPGHAGALALFGRLKGRRLAKGDAEAEAEQELARLAQAQARRAVEAARAARGAGWDRKALLALRRGLRLVPDDPELLGVLRETEHALDRAGARRRAGDAQVRAALERLKEGRHEEALESLRSLLRQDPDNVRAQAAIQEVRRAFLARRPAPPAPVPPAAKPTAPVPPAPLSRAPIPPAPRVPRPPAPVAARPPAPLPAPPPPGAPAPRTPGSRPHFVAAPPPEIALRRTRKGTPLLLVLGSAAVVIGLLIAFTSRPSARPAPAATLPASPPATAPSSTAPSATPPPVGPLSTADPEVRQAVETTLAAYARALESQDAELLARARPDLTAAERERLLAPFRGAVNVAIDLRVLDVIPSRGLVVVPVLRTDVIIGGRGAPASPVEETLRFERREGGWRLAGSSR
jgi:hypothetical protein